MIKPTGNTNQYFSNTALNDDQFYQLASHIDRKTKKLIKRRKYVDLAKLLKQSKRTGHKKENELEFISKYGKSYFLPNGEKDTVKINCFHRWEQVFRIYAGIFAQANPNRALELFQHVNNINEAAASFIWDNVYEYDIQFRELMSKYP